MNNRVTIAHATLEDLSYIASWLCKADRFELAATRDPDDYESLAQAAFGSSICHVALLDGFLPVFAFGAYPVDEETVHVWGFKTEDGPRAIRTVTRFLLRSMIPTLRALGIRRAQCYVHEDNDLSRRWLAHLGFWPEATPGEIGAPLILYQRDDAVAQSIH